MGLWPRRRVARISSPVDYRGSLTASGARIGKKDAENVRRLVQPWQTRAFSYYHQLGEIHYASQFYARSLALLDLYAGEYVENDDGAKTLEPTKDQTAVALLDRIQDPGGGRSGLLGSYGRLMFLAGETYLLCTIDEETGEERWEMLSTDELRVIGPNSFMRYKAPSLMAEDYQGPTDDDFEPLKEGEAVVYRLWKRDPQFSALSDSPMQPVLEICEELLILTRAVRARARSRLAGSGILFLDDKLMPPPLSAEGDENPEVDPFFRVIAEAMMTAIGDEGSASAVAPIVARVPVPEGKTLKDLVYHLQIIDPTQLYPETGLRNECRDRLAIGLDMPAEILTGMGDINHWGCADQETEILTENGWRSHDQLAVGDTILTLNHETGVSEWQPVKAVQRYDVVGAEMLAIEGRIHSSLTTLNHRWPVVAPKVRERVRTTDGRYAPTVEPVTIERGWRTSGTIDGNTDQIVTAAACAQPTLKTHSDALVELVAWFWTEGTCNYRPGRKTPKVLIYQSHTANPANVERIRQALTALYGDPHPGPLPSSRRGPRDEMPRWREARRSHGMSVFSLNVAAAEPLVRYAPARIVDLGFVRSLTRAQLRLFIETSVAADGSVMSGGTEVVLAKDPHALDAVELAGILLGRTTHRYAVEMSGFHRHVMWQITFSKRTKFKPSRWRGNLTHVLYSGIVWCPTVENSTWMARRRGKVFYTGNSWQVDEQAWKAHVQPMAQQLVDDLTAAYFRPALRAEGVKDAGKYAIGYDATAIINHPDRAKDAKDAHDRGAVGDKTLRDATGFEDSDAPTPEEKQIWISVKSRDPGFAVTGIPGRSTTSGAEAEAGTIDAGSSAAEVTKQPPEQPTGDEQLPETVLGSNGAAAARIIGACDMALLRAREVAGNRLRSLAKRDEDAAAAIRGVRASEVAAVLGPERVRALKAPSDRELVAGARDLVADALRLWRIEEPSLDRLVSMIEQHAARTLYELRPAQLPPVVYNYVQGLSAAK